MQTTANVMTIEINEPVVSIIQHQISNYYHWLLESLPKLLYLKELILDRPEYKHVKVLVPPIGMSRFIDETFEFPLLRELKSRFIYYQFDKIANLRYQFNKGLYIVDWIHPRHDIHQSLVNNIWGVYSPPKEVILKVHNYFNELLTSNSISTRTDNSNRQVKADIIYLSRKKGQNVRSFPNEDIWVERLEKYYKDRIYIHRGKETIMQQKTIFHTAKVVLGAHGAGITNMIFANKNTTLIMIPMHVSCTILYFILSFRSYIYVSICI